MRPVVGADDRGAALYSSLCKLYYQFRGTYPSECLQFGATIIIHHFYHHPALYSCTVQICTVL